MGQKDISEKLLLAYDDVFADLLNVLLFQGECVIRPEELEERGSKAFYKDDGVLRELDRDILKCWKGGDVRFACIGIENQTAVDADMTLRVIGYDGAAYRAQLSDREAGKARYPVVTMVLYFGYTKRWDKPLSLIEKLVVPERLQPFISDYKVNLFEVAYLSEEQVACFQSDFRVVADYFVQKRKNKKYNPSKQKLKHAEAVVQLLSVMEHDDRFADAFYSTDGRKVENMCDVLDEVEQRGRSEGIKLGISQGVAKIVKTLYGKGYKAVEISQMINEKEETVKDILHIL